jgi:hypothetical protein
MKIMPRVPHAFPSAGIALDIVDIDPGEAIALPNTELFKRTTDAFERVREYIPMGRDWMDGIDKRIQKLRHRERRPIKVISVFDYEDVIASPAARLTDGSGTFCITTTGEQQVYFGPINTPYVAALSSDARHAVTLQSAKVCLIDTEPGQEPTYLYNLERVGDLITGDLSITHQQKLGLGAVCLALEKSY